MATPSPTNPCRHAPSSSGPPPTLGVVAISYNEERDLPGFLENLLPWVNEIVIVDDGSTDATAEIAAWADERLKFIVSRRKAGEYYADQRNKGIDMASSEWLLHMDIDERVPPELQAEIRAAIQEPKIDGYRYRRRNFFLHRPMRGGGWQNWNLVHLARREKFRFGGMFHESCEMAASEERIGQLKHRMWHLNDSTLNERFVKSANYLPELRARVLKRGHQVKWYHILAAPVREFMKKYCYERGYRDGTCGLIWALHAASAIFRSYALVWDTQNRIPREELERAVGSEQGPETRG